MLIKTYTDTQIFARPAIVKKLYKLTNQGGSIDYYSGSAMRNDLDTKRPGQFFLMWNDGDIVGWALLNRTLAGYYQACCYVELSHRRQGIGRKLCNKMKKIADKSGETVRFQDEDDGMGIKLYSDTGFSYHYRCAG